MAPVNEKDPVQPLGIQERQHLKAIEDEIMDTLLVLDSTSDTILSVSKMYKHFSHDSPATSHDVNDDEFDFISSSLNEKKLDVDHNRKKVETLHVKVQGIANLVKICFLVLNSKFLMNDISVIQPSGSWKWKFSKKPCRRGPNGEQCYTKAY